MKLTTILNNSEAHPTLVITNSGLRAKWCLDLALVNPLLRANAWGIDPAPDSVWASPKADKLALTISSDFRPYW